MEGLIAADANPSPVACEALEPRVLLAAVTVNVGQVLRDVSPRVIGVNLNWWDT